MADSNNELLKTEEMLLTKHKKERKELQGQIQKLKHGVPKGDKKKKKDITEQIAKLEAELDQKQDQEIADLKSTQNDPDEVTGDLEALTTEDVGEINEDLHEQQSNDKKPSRAQKRRDKKAQEAKDRERRIQEETIDNLMGSRNVESEKIKALLDKRRLQIHEILSDGNCLYNALCHQLQQRGIHACNESLRKQAANYMMADQDNFLPFLTKDNGDLYTPDDFVKYCADLEKTPAWGGQLEIKALSHVLHMPVEVMQAEGPSLIIGEEDVASDTPLLLVYHRHAYGLGEHYNSVQPKSKENVDDFT